MRAMNRLEIGKIHTQLYDLGVIKPTNIFFWVNFCLVIGSLAGFLVGVVWFIDSIFGLSLWSGYAPLNYIQASILIIFPFFSLLIAIQIMEMVVKTRVERFLNTEKPDVKILEIILKASSVSGLSSTINKAVGDYISSQRQSW